MERKFLDVNVVAVFLDEDHVGHSFVQEAIMPGLRGAFRVLLNSYHLLRARWVLVSQWGLDPAEADAAVESLAEIRSVAYAEGDGRVVLRAIRLSRDIGHDVYDCFVAALADSAEATHLVTTDAGMQTVCEAVGIEYENPVPLDILRQFGVAGRD
ncbi:MAG: type II toxin-antitoxin system VapC family toxin [Thermoplasmata archaeon]